MRMELIPLPPDRYAEAKSLWKEVFSDSDAFLDLFFHTLLCRGQGFCLIEDGTLVSMLYLLDLPYFYDGEARKAYYLYAVATSAQCRNKGYFKQLYTYAERYAAEAGAKLLYCVPSDETAAGIYGKYGYEQRLSKKKYAMDVESLSKTYGVFPRAFDGNWRALFETYRSVRNGKEGSLKDFFWFQNAVAVSGGGILLFDNGYLLYDRKTGKIMDICSERDDFSAEYSPFCMVKCLQGQLKRAEGALFDSLLLE